MLAPESASELHFRIIAILMCNLYIIALCAVSGLRRDFLTKPASEVLNTYAIGGRGFGGRYASIARERCEAMCGHSNAASWCHNGTF